VHRAERDPRLWGDRSADTQIEEAGGVSVSVGLQVIGAGHEWHDVHESPDASVATRMVHRASSA